MSTSPTIYSEAVKFPRVRVLVYELPDGGGIEAEAIDAGAMGTGSSIHEALSELESALTTLYETSLETRRPMVFDPQPDELALHQSMGPGQHPKAMEDGRTLVAAYTLSRPIKLASGVSNKA